MPPSVPSFLILALTFATKILLHKIFCQSQHKQRAEGEVGGKLPNPQERLTSLLFYFEGGSSPGAGPTGNRTHCGSICHGAPVRMYLMSLSKGRTEGTQVDILTYSYSLSWGCLLEVKRSWGSQSHLLF